jgi:hypothetical protein
LPAVCKKPLSYLGLKYTILTAPASENSIEVSWFFPKNFMSPKNPGKFFSAQKKRLDKSNPTVQNSLPYVA